MCVDFEQMNNGVFSALELLEISFNDPQQKMG